jgi:hypothetical protein
MLNHSAQASHTSFHSALPASITPRDVSIPDGRGGRTVQATSAAQPANYGRAITGTEVFASDEVRKCDRCGGAMTSNRYQRFFVRFIRVYDCHSCNGRLKQEARGFQGFYCGALLALVAPPFWACFATNKVPASADLFVALFFLAACLPIIRNLSLYFQLPVIQCGRKRIMASEETNRNLLMRVLAGSNMRVGFVTGIILILSSYAFFSALVFGLSLR